MTSRELHESAVDQMWAERERRDQERLYAGIDWSDAEIKTYPPVRIPAPHRESFTVTIAAVKNGKKTLHTTSLLARDRDQAEFMALSYHTDTDGVYYVYAPLNK